jgi:uncharacterized protein YjgD (DUF1641 family)
MSQPIRLEFPPRDARAELLTRLQDAPLQHAEALLSGYDLLQRLHDRGVLDLLRGGLGSSDKVLSIAVDAAKTPEAIVATRNLLILRKAVFTLEPELLENIAKAVPNSLAQARKQKPLSLWQMFKTMCSQDTRRALSAMLGLLESFGKSLGTPSAARLERLESELEEIGCVVALDRRGR